MHRPSLALLTVTFVATSLMTACSRDLTMGEAIQGESADLAEIGAAWEEGDELVTEGQAEIEEGREMVAEGRDRIADGEDKVAAGKSKRREAERAYRALTGRPLPDL